MATRYVSTTGTDSGDGLTLATAWLTLQYAEDNASANDTIIVSEGDYNENDATFNCFNPAKALTWQTDGGTVTVTSTSATYVVVKTGTNSPTFTGFTFDGEGTTARVLYSANGVDNATFTDCTFTGGTTYLWLNAAASDAFEFYDCTFVSACSTDAINLGSATNTVFDGCVFSGTAPNMVDNAGGATTTINNCTGTFTATNEVIEDKGAGGSLTLTNNNFTFDGTPQGFYITGTNANSKTVTMDGNTINVTGTSSTGIIGFSVGSHTVDISNNTITSSSAAFDKDVIIIKNCTNPVVYNNTIDTTASTSAGIHINIGSTGTASHYPIIEGNTCNSSSPNAGRIIIVGTDATGAGDNQLNDGKIINNTVNGAAVYGETPNGIHGIEYGYNLRGKVMGNTVRGCSYGIVLKGGNGVSAGSDYGNIGGAMGNLIIDCTEASSIRIKGVTNSLVCNNTFIVTSAATPSGLIHITTNADTAANETSLGTVVKNNIMVIPSDMMLLSCEAACLDATYDQDWNIYYNSGADGFSMSFDGGTTTLTTQGAVATALAAAVSDDSNSVLTDPQLDSDYAISSSTSPAVQNGVRYWTGAPPTCFDNRPLPSYDIDIGGKQSEYSSFHPVNL